MIEQQQALLVKVMNLFAERFDKRAVLRGGMVLRVLGCERLTNDLDYIFMPYSSKKDIVQDIISTLNEIDGAQTEYSLDSKCLRVILTVDDVSIQIESKVAIKVPTQILSTKELAAEFNLPPRLIQVSDYPDALANKMAAWNERRLIRDIYDIWFYLRMGVKPNHEILTLRLKKCSYSKLVTAEEYFTGSEVKEFYDFLLTYVNQLTDKEIIDSLENYLSKSDLAGLSMKFRAELAKLKDI